MQSAIQGHNIKGMFDIILLCDGLRLGYAGLSIMRLMLDSTFLIWDYLIYVSNIIMYLLVKEYFISAFRKSINKCQY